MTGKPTKNSVIKFSLFVMLCRLSVWDFLLVSTSSVLFFNFLTDFGVPINDLICFSIMKGDKEVTGLEPS